MCPGYLNVGYPFAGLLLNSYYNKYRYRYVGCVNKCTYMQSKL